MYIMFTHAYVRTRTYSIKVTSTFTFTLIFFIVVGETQGSDAGTLDFCIASTMTMFGHTGVVVLSIFNSETFWKKTTFKYFTKPQGSIEMLR